MTADVFGIVGTTVAGAYHVEETVAEGGFGVVYRAYHAGFRAPVALKCLKIPQGLGSAGQESFLEQFRAEAELLFRLSASLNTVVRPLHVDALIAPGGAFVPFMALEWLEGETLEALVRRRKEERRPPLGLKRLVRLLTPVARALERAHNFSSEEGALSIVHRDLKPENIFLARVAGEEIVKILDFGIGKAKSVASQVAGRASQSGQEVGSFTPAYGAPEQWLPKRFGQTGPWTDVWGLAVTLVEALVGHPVIDGDHAAMMGTTLDEHRRPTPRAEGVEVSDEVEAVFSRALAVDPRDRYADAGLFWDDLVGAIGISEQAAAGVRRDTRAEDGFRVPVSERFDLPSRAPQVREALEAPARGTPALGAPALGTPVRGTPALGSASAPRAALPALDEAPGVAEPLEPPGEIPDLALPVREASPSQRPRRAPAVKLDLDLPVGQVISTREPARVEVSRDLGPATSRPASPRPEVLPPVSVRADRYRAPAPSGPSLGARLRGPLWLAGVGLVISLLHGVYAAQTGELLSIGPVRVSWVAGALVLIGIVVGALRLSRAS
ncbi:MAG: protein kinase [Polyangiaceae bacterium]|nr:protein kinase [Polyangiaceae bacterium]MCW5791156.1 protein kinase [Polyangiaceae bacterium]